MQAVILVAGKSTRTYPLTLTRPKPLLPVANVTIVEHILEQLKGLVDEVVLLVGYRKEMIENFIGSEWEGMKISYCEQKEQLGTGHAVLQTEPFIKDRFIVLNGDDIYAYQDVKALMKYEYGALVRWEEDPSAYGVFEVDDKNRVLNLVEKPKKFIGNLTNVGAYMFDKSIFDFIKKTPISERGEIEITSSILMFSKEKTFYTHKLQGFWLSNGYPWELLATQEYFLKQQKESQISGVVEKNAQLNGSVLVGEGTQIKSGAYIEGPVVIGKNCQIGPNCFIRSNTAISDNCRIGQGVEIKNSIIMNDTNICHLSYVGDSIIGENVNLGAGFTVANVRHDKKNVLSSVKGNLVDTGLLKFGVVIADNVKTGINTSIYPGRKIWPGLQTKVGEIVIKDVNE
ncbi:NTP transferase domain-containing protein [candidate division KSB1 bacterium]|nr:NTP transferase domain-containing protein [candidate division KSB1 bacterium]MBL7094040.1 NTP transferase domain-containing protein [candidate division KSB1 bacterium]